MLRDSGRAENSDEESDEEEKPKTFAQEMQELKDEVMRGIREEEYPFPTHPPLD